MTNGNALVFSDDNFASRIGNIKTGHLTAHALGNEFHLGTAVHQTEIIKYKEVGEDRLLI